LRSTNRVIGKHQCRQAIRSRTFQNQKLITQSTEYSGGNWYDQMHLVISADLSCERRWRGNWAQS